MSVKRLTTRGIATAQAIANREEFTTSGALKGEKSHDGYSHCYASRLSGADYAQLLKDEGRIAYVVTSYATPIAWVLRDGTVYKVAQKFSVTTTKHQGNLYLL